MFDKSLKLIGTILASIGLLVSLFAYSSSISEATIENKTAIEALERDNDIHRDDHGHFRQEYREDIRQIESKLDRLLEQQ
tara:strand:- start:279 stop:518 length:240 start_codon:yes stop_codon:yes gene_type:complete